MTDFTLPDTDDLPPGRYKGVVVFYISCFVGCNFGFPKSGVGFGKSGIFATLVPVPKASVNEDDRFVFGQHDVGLAGKFFVADAEAQSFCKQKFPNQYLGLGVLAMDCRHTAAPLLWCHRVGHIVVLLRSVVQI